MKEVGVLRVPGDRGEYLGRLIAVTESGFIMSAKEKYIDQLVSEFGFEHAKVVDNPNTRTTKENESLRVQCLEDDNISAYRGQVGRIMYVSHDRVDTQYVRRRTYRSMATQSQTTYTELRGVVNPRFQPLPEYQVGAWEK